MNRRIERLKRQQKREEEDAKNRTAEGRRASGSDDTASRNAKGKGKAAERADEDAEQEEEEDELDLDDGDVVVEAGPPKGSSSKPRAPDAGPSSGPAQLPAAKKKKRHRSPTPSSSDSSSSDDAPSRKKPKKRIRFDDDDFDTLVLMLDKSDRKGWTRQDLYKKLEQMVRNSSYTHCCCCLTHFRAVSRPYRLVLADVPLAEPRRCRRRVEAAPETAQTRSRGQENQEAEICDHRCR